MNDAFEHFSEALCSEMFRHYIGLLHKIRFEAELLGVTVLGTDFCDDNFWLEITFKSWTDVARFCELTEGPDYPGGEWDAEEHDQYMFGPVVSLFMPRADASQAWQTLKELAEATTKAKRRARVLAKHERRLGLPMARWGEHCPRNGLLALAAAGG